MCGKLMKINKEILWIILREKDRLKTFKLDTSENISTKHSNCVTVNKFNLKVLKF